MTAATTNDGTENPRAGQIFAAMQCVLEQGKSREPQSFTPAELSDLDAMLRDYADAVDVTSTRYSTEPYN